MSDSLQQIQEDQKTANSILQNAKDQIGEALKNQEHVRIGVEAHLSRASNFLHGLTGTAPDNASAPAFGPMTSFMGEPIERPEPVAPSDLAPTDSEKEAFRVKRDELLATIADRSDDDVFAILNQPQGEALLRNVGRKAGVPEYDTAAIDVNYLNAVRKGFAASATQAEAIAVGEDAKASKDLVEAEKPAAAKSKSK